MKAGARKAGCAWMNASALFLSLLGGIGLGTASCTLWAAEPSLPAGLGAPTDDVTEPALPAGLGGKAEQISGEAASSGLPFRLRGFWDVRGGGRLSDDPHQRDLSIAETRLQLELEKYLAGVSLKLTGDFLYDDLADNQRVDLETGEGVFDLREASLVFSPSADIDVKLGRQTLTWGTGDLVFINDLFPKDWVSFFIGRDVEYLKAPSDAFKLSAFTAAVNLDLVYTPRFDSDRFIDGRRLSFFDAGRGRLVGREAVVQTERPTDEFQDDEWAARLYRNVDAYEVALYGYHGFWKSPAGVEPSSGRATFPPLSVLGASLRGPVGAGIGNVELGYYDSRDDRAGDDPAVRNSELRLLLGYEQEIARNLTLGLQYYLERLRGYEAYRRALPSGVPARDENRHVLTQRLTWLTLSQNLEWSLFVFYSPSDRDAYLRPRVGYKVDDHLSVEVGGNLFLGEKEETFFGQFQDNNNLYLAMRYGF